MFASRKVFSSARVFASRKVFSSARMFASRKVFSSARVFASHKVFSSACVFASRKVFSSACVFASRKVFSSARVFASRKEFSSSRVFASRKVFSSARVFASREVFSSPCVGRRVKFPSSLHSRTFGCFSSGNIMFHVYPRGGQQDELRDPHMRRPHGQGPRLCLPRYGSNTPYRLSERRQRLLLATQGTIVRWEIP